VVDGERLAESAEQLMRSRYTAYVLGNGAHLFRTWHARTRPDDATPDPRVRWVGLEVLGVVGGGPDDDDGVVEFRARWVSVDDGPVRRGELHERSRFARRAGRWHYVDGEAPGAP
jgi:SEC-C motif-containing protein